ncbi:MAG: hypothetical protein EXR21_00800 [Flavobacteriaceae bacterium]|nr:hypothetical protein [Flavobacteriaceae bacterium]
MKVNNSVLLLLATGVIAFTACIGEIDNDPREIGKSLYPNKVGYEVIYDVYRLRWDDFKTSALPDTDRFQLREIIESRFIDNAGNQANRLVLYTRKNDSDNWLPYKVYSSLLSEYNFERSEDNKRLVKLVFPVGKDKSWNGNIYNAQDAERLKYTAVYIGMQIGNSILDSTVTVERKSDIPENDSNAVFKCTQKEIFAKGIGMVYHESDSINFTGGTSHNRWYGTRTKMTMVGHTP